jgi:uncharacterized C2H2 Zn-finger protein
MVWYEKLKEFGVSEEEFQRFCERYPTFKNNKELMAKLYLAVAKGIRVAEPKIVGEFINVADLMVGVVSRIKVVVVQQVDKRTYVGCPKCNRKLQAAVNTTVECPKCGVVKAQSLVWTEILAGDNTGEVILTIPPSVGRVPNEGEIIAVEGVLTENEEFLVYRYASAIQEKQQQIQVVQIQPQAIPQAITQVTSQQSTQETKLEFKCSICGKAFKNEPALKAHVTRMHKEEDTKQVKLESKEEEVKQEEVKPVQETKSPETKPEAKPPEAKPQEPSSESTIETAMKLARVAATIQKPYEEFKAYLESKFPGINVDEVIAKAGVKVEDGKLKKI